MHASPARVVTQSPAIDPRFGARGLGGAVREVVRSRELLVALIRRDLIVRYEHAVLGIAWALAVPLAQVGIFILVFTRVAPIDTEVPYALYAYAGISVWAFVSAATRAATRSMSDQLALVTKVYFPREVLPLGAVIVALIDFAVTFIPLALLMIWFGVPAVWSQLAAPLALIPIVLLTAGLALLTSIANVFYRDVRHVVDVLLLIGMFATSVVYPVDRIGGVAGRICALNPLTPMLDAYRAALFGSPLPSAVALAAATTASVIVFFGAWALFHRMEPVAAELA
jgi:ABC-type polysaccharide/polyol phosphate export permease